MTLISKYEPSWLSVPQRLVLRHRNMLTSVGLDLGTAI